MATSQADGSSCYLPNVVGPAPGRFYIVTYLSPLSGITGAEFRATGMPDGFFRTVTPNPAANLTLGDPFGQGCNIAFPVCQSSPTVLLLFTIDFFDPTSGQDPFELTVGAHATPSNPNFACPLVVLCDGPVFTTVCVNGVQTGTGPILAVPAQPSPADGAQNVTLAAQLSWGASGFQSCCGLGTPSTGVRFGTVSPPPLVHQAQEVLHGFNPGPLAPFTTYYWRISWTPDHDCGAVSGPIWSFTTGDVVGVEQTTWQGLKGLFR